MRKITLYVISKCPLTASAEEFAENMCTIVSKKKYIGEYVANKLIVDNYDHYISWLQNHYPEEDDDDIRRKEYLRNVIDDEQFKGYCVKTTQYTLDGLASAFRIFNRCIPVGASYETATEVTTITEYLRSILKNVEKEVDKPINEA